jgi:hypothetical protein
LKLFKTDLEIPSDDQNPIKLVVLMAKIFTELSPRLKDFILDQKIFFVGTAAEEGRINVSPKGMDSLRVIDSNKVIWINLTGSGNETAAHLLKKNRITIMFCSFDKKPLILRLYGSVKMYHDRDEDFHIYLKLFPKYDGVRQVVDMKVESVQTSCGFAVPRMDFLGERDMLRKWTEHKGKDGVLKFQTENNIESIDGFETDILK